MARLIKLSALVLATSSVFASPLASRVIYAVKENHHVPQKWSVVGVPPKDHVLHLQIGLKQSQFDELERQLMEGMFGGSRRAASATLLAKRTMSE